MPKIGEKRKIEKKDANANVLLTHTHFTVHIQKIYRWRAEEGKNVCKLVDSFEDFSREAENLSTSSSSYQRPSNMYIESVRV